MNGFSIEHNLCCARKCAMLNAENRVSKWKTMMLGVDSVCHAIRSVSNDVTIIFAINK